MRATTGGGGGGGAQLLGLSAACVCTGGVNVFACMYMHVCVCVCVIVKYVHKIMDKERRQTKHQCNLENWETNHFHQVLPYFAPEFIRK